tara:strand:+ start:1251 stop:2108 length:858 start_codon:yes stop_codon:yes gene_type:complete
LNNIKKIVNKNILIVGDSIIDRDIYIEEAGTSLETPSLRTKYTKESVQLGGAARVVNFISKFDVNIEFFSNLEEKYLNNFDNLYNSLNLINTNTLETLEKIRMKLKNKDTYDTYLQINKDYKSSTKDYADLFNFKVNNFDLILINDYRTGMFNKKLINKMNKLNARKIVLASQLSNNVNNISNYKNFNLLILNKREFEMEFNTKLDLNNNYSYLFSNKLQKIIVTLGEDGALLIEEKNNIYFPTKSLPYKNTIGAGDIFIGSYLIFEDIDLANKHAMEYLKELNE